MLNKEQTLVFLGSLWRPKQACDLTTSVITFFKETQKTELEENDPQMLTVGISPWFFFLF